MRNKSKEPVERNNTDIIANMFQTAADYSLGKVNLDNLRFSLGNTAAPPAALALAPIPLSRTTISLLDYAFLSHIGKCRWAASSENIREQCGHCLLLSMAFWSWELTVLPVRLYWLALSAEERPRARLICSLSYFHLGTSWALIGLLSSFWWCTLRGGFAEVNRGFFTALAVWVLIWCPLSRVWNSITLGAWAF